MTPLETALGLFRQRLEAATRRATLVSTLGALPKPRPMLLFRREVIALPFVIEVRHNPEKERIRRRLIELSRRTH